MLRFACIIAAATACAVPPLAAEERVWTDTQGRTMRAEFLREVDGEAVFLKDGKLLTVPLDRFAEADREAMKKLAEGKPLTEGGAKPQDPFVTVKPAPEAGGPAAPLFKSKTEIVNRDWSDIHGNRATGKFVRVAGRDVVILRASRAIVVPFDQLSPPDRAYVNQILEERGQQPLVSPSAPAEGRPFDGEPLGRPDVIVGPLGPLGPLGTDVAESEPGPIAAGNSQFFRELRERQEETREAQAQFAEQNNADSPATPPPAAAESSGAEAVTVVPAPDAPKPRKISGRTVIKAETLAELRPVLIVGVVVIGLFAAVGIIVYIATLAAAGNSRRQRRYL